MAVGWVGEVLDEVVDEVLVAVDGVAQPGAFAVDPGGDFHPGDAVSHLDVVNACMVGGVVPAAQQGHRVDVGGSAPRPGNGVVGIATTRAVRGIRE